MALPHPPKQWKHIQQLGFSYIHKILKPIPTAYSLFNAEDLSFQVKYKEVKSNKKYVMYLVPTRYGIRVMDEDLAQELARYPYGKIVHYLFNKEQKFFQIVLTGDHRETFICEKPNLISESVSLILAQNLKELSEDYGGQVIVFKELKGFDIDKGNEETSRVIVKDIVTRETADDAILTSVSDESDGGPLNTLQRIFSRKSSKKLGYEPINYSRRSKSEKLEGEMISPAFQGRKRSNTTTDLIGEMWETKTKGGSVKLSKRKESDISGSLKTNINEITLDTELFDTISTPSRKTRKRSQSDSSRDRPVTPIKSSKRSRNRPVSTIGPPHHSKRTSKKPSRSKRSSRSRQSLTGPILPLNQSHTKKTNPLY